MKFLRSKPFLNIDKENVVKNITIRKPGFFCEVGQNFKLNKMRFQIIKINPLCCLDYIEVVKDEKIGERKSMGLSVFRKYYSEGRIELI